MKTSLIKALQNCIRGQFYRFGARRHYCRVEYSTPFSSGVVCGPRIPRQRLAPLSLFEALRNHSELSHKRGYTRTQPFCYGLDASKCSPFRSNFDMRSSPSRKATQQQQWQRSFSPIHCRSQSRPGSRYPPHSVSTCRATSRGLRHIVYAASLPNNCTDTTSDRSVGEGGRIVEPLPPFLFILNIVSEDTLICSW